MELIKREARRKDIVIGTRLKEISFLEGKADDHVKGFMRLQVFG